MNKVAIVHCSFVEASGPQFRYVETEGESQRFQNGGCGVKSGQSAVTMSGLWPLPQKILKFNDEICAI